MSVADLYETFFVALAHMDRIFEFWMTASFGAVVAAHFMSGRVSDRLSAVLAFLYSLFSLNLLVRYLLAGAKMREMRSRLIEAGESYPDSIADFSGAVGGAVFVLGFGAVLYFIWQTRSSAAPN